MILKLELFKAKKQHKHTTNTYAHTHDNGHEILTGLAYRSQE